MGSYDPEVFTFLIAFFCGAIGSLKWWLMPIMAIIGLFLFRFSQRKGKCKTCLCEVCNNFDVNRCYTCELKVKQSEP